MARTLARLSPATGILCRRALSRWVVRRLFESPVPPLAPRRRVPPPLPLEHLLEATQRFRSVPQVRQSRVPLPRGHRRLPLEIEAAARFEARIREYVYARKS